MATTPLEKLYKYVEPREAVKILIHDTKPTIAVEVDVRESCFHTIAEDVYSPIDRPWTNISHFDGYAVRSIDTQKASSTNPVKLRIIQEVDPRNAHQYTLGEGEAVYVETGYPLPINADSIVPVESTRRIGDYILVYHPARPGDHVIHMSGDVAKGELILRKGAVITPAIQNLLISLGIERVLVRKPPRVSIISIGSELTDEPIAPTTSKIPASSAYMVENTVKFYGGEINEKTIVNDDTKEIVETISQILEEADLIITIGGVSMGPKDLTWTSIHNAFKSEHGFRGIKVQPGRATSGFNIKGKIIVNLPGLPQSTFTGLVTIVLPVLNYLLGRRAEINAPFINARSKQRYIIKGYPSFYRLRFAVIENGAASLIVENNSSYFIKPIALSNGFTIIPPNKTVVEKGEELKVYILPPFYNPTSTIF